MDLFDFPQSVPASHRGVDTSVEAWRVIAPTIGAKQRAVLDAIAAAGANGLTGDEAAQRIGWERWAVRPRLSELKSRGDIVDSKRRRVNQASGINAIVWILKRYRDDAQEAAHD